MRTRAFDWGPLLKGGPLFIGILNLTPDSFSDGGKFMNPDAALARAQELVRGGARMLDLGGESTRPGAAEVDSETEWSRIHAVLSALKAALPDLPLSLDTRHPEVAARGLGHGISVVNDVSGCSEPALLALVRTASCGLIAMRSRRQGRGFLMPAYDDPAPRPADSAITELRTVRDRLRLAGVADARVLLDPGFGFGMTYQEDKALWEALAGLPGALGWPPDRICIGISRKRFLACRAGQPSLPPGDRDLLTTAAHAEAIQWGYRVFRTHAIG